MISVLTFLMIRIIDSSYKKEYRQIFKTNNPCFIDVNIIQL